MQAEKTTKLAPQKKYICGFCAKAFTRSEHKQRHERSHTNEKPFHCLQCTSSFVRRDLLQRHCRTVHQIQDGPKRKSQDLNQSITLLNISTEPLQLSHSIDLQNESGSVPFLSQQMQSDAFQITNSSSTSSSSSSLRNNSLPFPFDPQDHLPLTTMGPSTSLNSETSPSKKRKKSESGSGGVLGMRRNSSLSMSTSSNDTNLINLLSITKKLDYILKALDVGVNESISDSFLIGFNTLQELLAKFPIFDTILKDLMYYLSTFYIPSGNGGPDVGIVPPPMTPSLSQPNHFKTGIIYSVISLGCIVNKNTIKSMVFFKKAWILLIKRLIPQYNNSNVSMDQIEIASNLFLLAYIYVSYDLENYDINNEQVNQVNGDDTDEQIYLNNTVILEYLDQISYIIISNLADFSNPNEKLIDSNMNLFWSIYIILSFYFHNRNPKMYPSFLHKSVGQDDDLLTVMQKFSKSYSVINEQDDFLKMIVVATIGNELKTSRALVSNSSDSDPNAVKIYESKNVLHNSVILINRSINVFQFLPEHNTKLKLFELFRKNLIINSPLKYRELLSNYIFIPQSYTHWQLLYLTLDEATINYDLHETLHKSVDDPNQLNSLEYKLKLFLDYKKVNLDINNNISIVSLPVIFFANYLNLNLIDCGSFNQLQLKNIKLFLIHWYMVMNKLLIMMWCDDLLQFEDNYILQTFIFMLLDNKQLLLKRLNIEGPQHSAMYEGVKQDISEFKFNKRWFWIVKMKLDNVFEQWMHHVKVPFLDNSFATVKIQVAKYINEHIALEGLVFKEDDPEQEPQQQQQQQQQLVFNNSGPNLASGSTPSNRGSISTGMLTSTSMNYSMPMQQQVSSNFINYGSMNDFAGGGAGSGGGAGNASKRSNSISLVMLLNFVKDIPQQKQQRQQHQQQPQQLPTGGKQSQQMQPLQLQQLQQGQTQGQQGQQFYSYSSYPPPPPILSSMPKELVLPPISSERRNEKYEVTY